MENSKQKTMITLEVRSATNYFTLWMVCSEKTFYRERYVKNLSTDWAEAIKKAEELSLIRNTTFIDYSQEVSDIIYGGDVLRFGKYKGTRIAELQDGYLLWLAKDCFDSELKQKAVNECVKRGLYVEYEGEFKPKTLVDYILKRKTSVGHHFENGQKVKGIKVKINRSTSFESTFGDVYVFEFETEDNKLIVYKGSKCSYTFNLPEDVYPDQLGLDPYLRKGDSLIVNGTIEHSEYRGEKTTYIKRPKFLNQFTVN